MPLDDPDLPEFVSWPTFPFEGSLRPKALEPPADEPARRGDDPEDCPACSAPDEEYVWVSARWRVRATDRPSAVPVVLRLESRSHLDLGDLPNLLAAELGVMTVRLERAVRSLSGVARVHVNRWGDGSAHLHVWFYARPAGQLQLRGSFLPMWNDLLPAIPDEEWRANLGVIAAWLADFGGRAMVDPPRFEWGTLEPDEDPDEENPDEERGLGSPPEAGARPGIGPEAGGPDAARERETGAGRAAEQN